MSLPLFTRAAIAGEPENPVLKVTTLEEFLASRYSPGDCALWFDGSPATKRSRAVSDLPWGALISTSDAVSLPEALATCTIGKLRDPGVIGSGDVIRISGRQNLISVLHRRRSRTNSLLVTERCNSYCLMCSQPPVQRDDDSARVDELLRITSLIDSTEPVLGITGGEPTLLGSRFIDLLVGCRTALPNTTLHVLTNGRNFANQQFANACVQAASGGAVWAIPLYTDVAEIHDFVVQRQGAFTETMQGLMHLAQQGQPIELRIVLQRATVPRLQQFAEFVVRNLNFVDHVAWMGLEPMGFARPNWHELWVDPGEYASSLNKAVTTLERADIETSIFNLPLCVLPQGLWRFAAQSISDWKNEFESECAECAVKDKCCGFFVSARNGYRPGRISPIARVEHQHAEEANA